MGLRSCREVTKFRVLVNHPEISCDFNQVPNLSLSLPKAKRKFVSPLAYLSRLLFDKRAPPTAIHTRHKVINSILSGGKQNEDFHEKFQRVVSLDNNILFYVNPCRESVRCKKKESFVYKIDHIQAHSIVGKQTFLSSLSSAESLGSFYCTGFFSLDVSFCVGVRSYCFMRPFFSFGGRNFMGAI